MSHYRPLFPLAPISPTAQQSPPLLRCPHFSRPTSLKPWPASMIISGRARVVAKYGISTPAVRFSEIVMISSGLAVSSASTNISPFNKRAECFRELSTSSPCSIVRKSPYFLPTVWRLSEISTPFNHIGFRDSARASVDRYSSYPAAKLRIAVYI